MSKIKIARSYATAIYEISKENGQADTVLNELISIEEMLRTSKDLTKVLAAKQLAVTDKQAIMDVVAEKINASALTRKALKLLVKKDRMNLMSHIVSEFLRCGDETSGILRGTVTTTEPISRGQIEELEKAFTKKFNKTVLLEAKEDKAIIGGLLVRIGDLSFDGSLKTALQNIKNSLERQYV